MWQEILGLLGSLAVILLSCEFFTNGIEWLGKKLKLGDGVVGSIFSAVGTCLPETMIPIIAILFSENTQENVDVGIGAIAGAPFMLSTLAFFITGLSALIFWKRRNTGLTMQVNTKILGRDIGFFILVYAVGIGSTFIENSIVKHLIAAGLVLYYLYYIYLTVKQDAESHLDVESLYLVRLLKVKNSLPLICIQIILALSGIVLGAHLFVESLSETSHLLGIPALVLSLILTPIATELPEKFNSVLWVSKKKDTLALGNITGAMVFQSCIPVAIGISFTHWQLDDRTILSGVLAIVSASVAYLFIKLKGSLNALTLLLGGVFYIIFILYVFGPLGPR